MNMKDEMSKEFDIDLETADRIAKEYPSLSDSAKERMFNMTKKKINLTNAADEDNNDSVHGVEKYNRPGWIKFAGMAAAVAIIAGGFGGGTYLFHKMKDSAPNTSATSGTEPATESSSFTTETATESSVITSITTITITTAATTATTAVAETTTEATETKSLTPEEEIAHNLTDNYWDYECFFHTHSHSMTSQDASAKGINLKYSYQRDGRTIDTELTYIKTDDERLTESTIDGLKKLYNTYYSKTCDPFYSDHVQNTKEYELFGPSFTADTLTTDTQVDRIYTFIEYEGELYQRIIPSQYFAGTHWSDNKVDITDVTEKSFTLKRKIHYPPKEGEVPGEFTFKIVFDEDVQDWRIEQVDEEYEFTNTSATAN
ncbi:hypothetical protein [Ruminococcus flavefaciens]|uniref:hypothetical protein n=1 Tax=Ruminococcus flavefaciens TaxID=1265 RepID=UPI0002DE1638|nr:hypothetical protein [Ruminococcus flavefaciens]